MTDRFLITTLTVLLMFMTAGHNIARAQHIIAGSGTSVAVTSDYKVYPGDAADHEIRYVVRQDRHTSGEPDWNDVTSMVYSLIDQQGINGTHSGYQVFTHANGDRSFSKFTGKQTVRRTTGGGTELHFEGTFQWTGGTGKFEYINGSGTYKGKIDAAGVTTYTYEGNANY